MPKVRVKRGTLSQINTAASANSLSEGEVYLITDEGRIAIGLSVSTFEKFAKFSEAGGGTTFGTAIVDFGTAGNEPETVKVTVSNPAVVAGSKPVASISINTTTRDADELEMESFVCQIGNVNAGAGFDVFVNNPTGGAEGQYIINYSF